MHISNVLLPLAAAGVAVASPLEKRAASSCAVPSISSLVNAVYKPSAVPFCNSFLSAGTKTITAQTTISGLGQKTVTSITTVTATGKASSAAKASTTITAAAQTATAETVPKNPSNAQSASVSSTSKAKRDLERRSTGVTPSRLRTLSPAEISSVCGCLTTTAITTTTHTATANSGTTTILQTATVTTTPSATPSSFYLKVGINSGLSIDGEYGVVSGETMTFTNNTSSATKFTLDASGHLISGTNGWIANMQKGSDHSTLFFDSPSLISSLGLVEATCKIGAAGHLNCVDQSATALYYCDYVGAEVVLAQSGYTGAGCSPILLNPKSTI